ncbi:uncharacterized protein Fot_08999 [Forsythia ovata]|uniref:C2 NT-type domain-containing protein n=1 Tax=Forsythia ovata TaxID=205694 RepID=A0ABD1WCS2_9LAMI
MADFRNGTKNSCLDFYTTHDCNFVRNHKPEQDLVSTYHLLAFLMEFCQVSTCDAQARTLITRSSLADGRIEFNKSSRLPVTLLREMSIKSGNGDTFQKNCLKFNLYKPRSNKIIKGQLLGTAVVALAEYGVVEESLSINAPINCKRTYKNTTQPLLFLEIQLVKRREASMDRNHSNSVSAMMSKEYAEESKWRPMICVVVAVADNMGTVYA